MIDVFRHVVLKEKSYAFDLRLSLIISVTLRFLEDMNKYAGNEKEINIIVVLSLGNVSFGLIMSSFYSFSYIL